MHSRARHRGGAVARRTALAALALTLVPACAGARTGPAASPSELVWVASADADPVYAYSASATGSVAPVGGVDNPNDPNAFWDPWGVAFDSAGHLYVQSFLSDATTFVFAPGSGAGAPPLRDFEVIGPDSRAIAVDGAGYEYVLGSEGTGTVAVAPPGAAGQAASLYQVSPVRTFEDGAGGYDPWPDILSLDGAGNVVVAVGSSAGNAIATYPGGPGGSDIPTSTLVGPRTRLGACTNFSSCTQVSIAGSAFTHRVYAAVSGGAAVAHISVFAERANGNAAPLRTIQGSRTGLTGQVITGIADSQATGDIYAMVKSGQFGMPGRIEVFSRYASGNATPLRTFTDGANGFVDAEGIAVHAG